MIDELKCCPFCGGPVHIHVTDSCGNKRDPEYEFREYHRDGLYFKLVHDENDVPEGKECPIATFKYEIEGSGLGTYLYSSRENAITAWNTRYKSDELPGWLLKKLILRLRDIDIAEQYYNKEWAHEKREEIKWVLSLRRGGE